MCRVQVQVDSGKPRLDDVVGAQCDNNPENVTGSSIGITQRRPQRFDLGKILGGPGLAVAGLIMRRSQ